MHPAGAATDTCRLVSAPVGDQCPPAGGNPGLPNPRLAADAGYLPTSTSFPASGVQQHARVRVACPINKWAGSEDSAVVYFEVRPGDRLACHTDSAEEIL
jgi:hypothetical protein